MRGKLLAGALTVLLCLAWVSAAAEWNSTSLHFTGQPTDAEIVRARVFDEPLAPGTGKVIKGENKALAHALESYADRKTPDDFSSLTGFLEEYPGSRWCASLLLHLGTEYCNSGYYSKALAAWEQAWARFQQFGVTADKSQADRALGELARMYSRLGRMSDLSALLDATKDRALGGPATPLMAQARQTLWAMQNSPGTCFRCGSLALETIIENDAPGRSWSAPIRQSQSTTNGLSLKEVGDTSRQLGMDYQMAYRSAGAPLIFPSVVHWKAEHFTALLQQQGDRILAKDSTFLNSLWMTTNALSEESSGYFLVPPGPLPAGWRIVADTEAAGVWGRGVTSSGNPGGTGGPDPSTGGPPGSPPAGPPGPPPPGPPPPPPPPPPDPPPPPPCGSGAGGGGGPGRGGSFGMPTGMPTGMPAASMHIMLVSLILNDAPVGYTPPVGPPVNFQVAYHQLEANQPATFYYSNLGQKWTCNWLAYITDNPTSPNGDVSFYEDGGGTLNFTGFNTTSQSYAPEQMTSALLIKNSTSSYEMDFRDGSKKLFQQSDGSIGSSRRVFMSRVVDPAGNPVQLNYDSQLRITNLTDAIGQSTTLLYTNAAYPYAITTVIDPFDRAAYFEYNTNGRLSQITDVLGLSSQFAYGANDFITSMTTPYGTTTFTNGTANGGTWLQIANPLGETERLEFNQNQIIPFSEPATTVPHGMGTWNNYLYGRNAFYWDKKAYAEGHGDYTKATIYHFCHDVDGSKTSRVLESVKQPLENRVWYNHPNQAVPAFLNTGTTAQPNAVGRVLDDGTSQVSTYAYDSLGNVTNVVDPVGRAFTYLYDTNGVDLLETRMTHDGKNELLNRTMYNSQHKPLRATDAAGQTTTNNYNARGQLLSTINARGETNSFTYDTNGYLFSVTGPLQTTNDVSTFTYDGFERVRTLTDTEGYTLTFDYDPMNRRTRTTYPGTTFEQYVYDRLDVVATCDRLGRWTTNTFNAIRQLVQTVDPLNRTNIYQWCHCGALTSLIDPMGRKTSWRYDMKGRVTTKQYVDGSTVEYTYEATANRLKLRRDEKGQFTYYEYYQDNDLKRVSYPNASVATPTVNYTYDPDYNRLSTMEDGIGTTFYSYYPITPGPSLGASQLGAVSGPLPNSTVTYQYDQLGRVVGRAINGVAQALTYDSLGRPTVITNALGAFTNSYVNATRRLASETYSNGQTNRYSYYDNLGDQRLQQIMHLQPNGALLSSFSYGYNAVGQITNWAYSLIDPLSALDPRTVSQNFGYDAADQLTNATGTSTLGNSTAPIQHNYVYDPAGNRLQADAQQFGYNALNQVITGPGATNVSYEWDAENRLTAVNQGTHRSEFGYDGLGRRVRIVEKEGGAVVSGNYYLWCNNDICEVRDATGSAVVRRLYQRGEKLLGAGGTNYFYTKDHLGSIREALDDNGTLATRYDYDPYGQRTIIQENVRTIRAYGGHFLHAPSGLHLTLFRAFDATIGRWLSRDPIQERDDINRYQYVHNCPINLTDPLGLATFRCKNPLGGGHGIMIGPAYHESLCVVDPRGITCGGQGPSDGIFGSPGVNMGPHGNASCKPVDANDSCVSQKITSPERPNYNILDWNGENCQTWAEDVITSCGSNQ